jgi:hypothetical protein
MRVAIDERPLKLGDAKLNDIQHGGVLPLGRGTLVMAEPGSITADPPSAARPHDDTWPELPSIACNLSQFPWMGAIIYQLHRNTPSSCTLNLEAFSATYSFLLSPTPNTLEALLSLLCC